MIQIETQKYEDIDLYAHLHPLLREWFRHTFKAFTEPQRYAVMNIHQRQHTLVSAPTGTGKTLSAFLSILNELLTLSDAHQLEDRVYCVYVSPLRALSNDIEKNLNQPLHEIGEMAKKEGKTPGIRAGLRTGDTPAGERTKMLRKPPHILITTPESLALMLNAPKFKENLRNVQWAILDEIHSLAENKRGVHLSLTLERLQTLSPNLTRIGLSATIAPLEEVAQFLVGKEDEKKYRDCKIVDVQFIKKLDLKVLCPLPDLVNVTQKQVHGALYDLLDQLIQDHKTTLIFTNTRSATERVIHHLKERFPGRYDSHIGAHHSSLSREHRLMVETQLKEGKLKACVSSTSLELGIDIGFIDLVVLLGSPKSVARCLQRVGRAGHKLHDTVKGRIIVLDRDDLVECSVLLKQALEKNIDRIHVPKNCLDVLSQHVYGMAIDQVQGAEDIWNLVKRTHPFATLARSDFNEVLNYLSGEYASLEVRRVYAKIWWDRETGMLGKRGKTARRCT